MIDGFDVTSIDSIREQFVAWVGTFRFGKGKIEAAEGAEGLQTYYGNRFRIEVDQREDARSYVKLTVWTEKHSYGIVGKPSVAGSRDYLGCVMSKRAPRAGEDWTRGGDLADGSFTEATWLAILTGILGYESQAVHVPTKGQPIHVG